MSKLYLNCNSDGVDVNTVVYVPSYVILNPPTLLLLLTSSAAAAAPRDVKE